jgi:hypothetical protein
VDADGAGVGEGRGFQGLENLRDWNPRRAPKLLGFKVGKYRRGASPSQSSS